MMKNYGYGYLAWIVMGKNNHGQRLLIKASNAPEGEFKIVEVIAHYRQ